MSHQILIVLLLVLLMTTPGQVQFSGRPDYCGGGGGVGGGGEEFA